jgi:hypothetical protein
MTDWKPVNPCTSNCKSRDSYCPPRNRFGCASYEIYQGKLEMAKQLLEYIRTKCIRDWYKLYGEEIYEEIIKMESELEASQ